MKERANESVKEEEVGRKKKKQSAEQTHKQPKAYKLQARTPRAEHKQTNKQPITTDNKRRRRKKQAVHNKSRSKARRGEVKVVGGKELWCF